MQRAACAEIYFRVRITGGVVAAEVAGAGARGGVDLAKKVCPVAIEFVARTVEAEVERAAAGERAVDRDAEGQVDRAAGVGRNVDGVVERPARRGVAGAGREEVEERGVGECHAAGAEAGGVRHRRAERDGALTDDGAAGVIISGGNAQAARAGFRERAAAGEAADEREIGGAGIHVEHAATGVEGHAVIGAGRRAGVAQGAAVKDEVARGLARRADGTGRAAVGDGGNHDHAAAKNRPAREGAGGGIDGECAGIGFHKTAGTEERAAAAEGVIIGGVKDDRAGPQRANHGQRRRDGAGVVEAHGVVGKKCLRAGAVRPVGGDAEIPVVRAAADPEEIRRGAMGGQHEGNQVGRIGEVEKFTVESGGAQVADAAGERAAVSDEVVSAEGEVGVQGIDFDRVRAAQTDVAENLDEVVGLCDAGRVVGKIEAISNFAGFGERVGNGERAGRSGGCTRIEVAAARQCQSVADHAGAADDAGPAGGDRAGGEFAVEAERAVADFGDSGVGVRVAQGERGVAGFLQFHRAGERRADEGVVGVGINCHVARRERGGDCDR